VLESLVKAGAMDSLAAGSPALSALPLAAVRARLFAAVEKALDYGNRTRRDRDQGQAQLFCGTDDPAGAGVPIEAELPEAPPWTEAQQLSGEKESLGLFWSGHPIERYSEELRTIGARPIAELLADGETAGDEENGATEETAPRSFEATVGGIIVAVRPLKTRKGARMAAFTLDDPQGSLEVIVFPDAFEKAVSLIQTDSLVLVKGIFERDEDKAKLKANEIVSIDAVCERAARSVAVRLRMPPHDRATVEAVLGVLSRHRGDRRVTFEIELRGGAEPLRVRADLQGPARVRPSADLLAELERICGPGSAALR
jgi:DNA polymerase-3 subunit alpha